MVDGILFACKNPVFVSQMEIVGETSNYRSSEMLWRTVVLQLLAKIKGLFSAVSQKIIRDVSALLGEP